MKIFMLFFCLCISRISCQNETEIQKTFDLLEQGQRQIILTNETEVVLVFGATGCGKSTFIQWIAGDNSNLIAKETFPDSGEYLIEDTNDKIGSSTLSKTLFPELVTDSTTGTTIYDFPGFSDTRSSSHDIAASFFMKTVMDHVQKVKMIFLTSYYTVQKGMDRAGFPSLLKNIVDLIGDVDKFKNSIALAVTKVDNTYIKHKRTLVLKPDSTVIKGIANYLVEVRKVYENDLKKPDISDKKGKFSANAIKIINIFLTQEDGEYTRITLFRRPEEDGLLSESELLLEGKLIVQHLIAENLRFSQTDPDDFGFTISDNSKLEIDSLVTVINEEITEKVDGLVTDIRTKLESFVEPVRVQIDSDNIEALNLTQSHEFSMQSDLSQTVLSEAVNFFTHVNGIHGIEEKMNKYLTALKVAVPESLEENMTKFSKYFEFFQLFNEIPLKTSSLSWTKSFQSALTYLIESKQFIRVKASLMAEEINSRITSDVESIAEDVKAIFVDDVDEMTKIVKLLADSLTMFEVNDLAAKAFHEKLMFGEESIEKLVESSKDLPKPLSLSDEISKALSSMRFELPTKVLLNIEARSKEFEILEVVSSTNFSFPAAQWSNSFKTIVTYIQTQNILTIVAHAREAIESNVDALLKSSSQEVQGVFDKKSLELEIDQVGDEFKKWHLRFSSICDVLAENSTLKELSDNVILKLTELSVNDKLIRDNLRSLATREKYLGFLQSLEGKRKDVIAIKAWQAYIRNLADYFDTQLNFNTFVLALHETLSQFDVQKDVSRYDVLDLSDWGESGHAQGIHVDKNNFKLFMEKIEEFNIKAAKQIKNFVPSESQISILNNVLKATLRKRIVTQCPNEANATVVLKANFIKFSDFLDSNGLFKSCGWTNIKSLEIYALTTLFIDQDLDALGEMLELSIVAHKWEVIGKKTITLDGQDGKFIPKAADGPFPSGHGVHGLPGITGGSAGAFFGVVSSFIGSENITISANGGNGGPGQSGGNGANGQDGRNPHGATCDIDSYRRSGFRVDNRGKWTCGAGECQNTDIFGDNGGVGGNAGSCGVGGRAGLPGPITVINLSESSREMKISIEGNRGANGISGAVGLGGRNGDFRGVSCRREWFLGIFSGGWYGDWYVRSSRTESKGVAARGVPSSACNAKLPLAPLPARIIQDAGSSLRSFVQFFIKNSNDRFVRFYASKIYDQINTNPGTREIQNTVELIRDLKMLESCTSYKSLNLIPFFKSHLKNIENYAANPKITETSDEFKKVLSHLYTASLTQISNLKKSQDSDLVIDVSGYLDIVSQNVKTLSNLKDESRLLSTVETLKTNFKHEIDKKIDEANSLIEFAITPEIDNIGYKLDHQISGLIREVLQMQGDTKHEIAELETKRRELENSMWNKMLGSSLKIISTVCSYFGPVGSVIGMAIDKGTKVVDALAQGKDPDLPSLLSDGAMPNVREIGMSMLDLANSMKKEKNNIGDLSQGIRDLENVLKELERFETSIYEKLIPMIEKMGNDLIKIASNLESRSSVSLIVIGWKVQDTMRDASLEIQQFTRSFKVEDPVLKLMEKQEDVIKTLIKVYDRIQDYQEQQRLAVYMADLSSVSVQQIDVSNPVLSDSFRDLQISIRSNILLNQYNSVLNAFKQWIFPFAEVFLEDFQLPENLVSGEKDIETLASTASSRIEEIRSRIRKYKTTIEDFDKHIYLAQFNGSSSVMNPFYVWTNEEHREMITKLLAGESVLAVADVEKSSAGKDAIKFNFIELGFRSKNMSIQAEVNENLLNYGINMTHLGNSKYRYSDQYFAIPSSSQSLHYSFEKISNGKAAYGNNVYYKLLAGDIMLSPYTMWELKLTLDQFKSVKSFSSLSKFWDKVDLVLEGSGSFVNTGDTKFDVQSYYKVDDSIKLA